MHSALKSQVTPPPVTFPVLGHRRCYCFSGKAGLEHMNRHHNSEYCDVFWKKLINAQSAAVYWAHIRYSPLNCRLRPYDCGGWENLIRVYRQHLSRDLKCHWCWDVNIPEDPEITALIQVINYNDVLKLEHWPRLATLLFSSPSSPFMFPNHISDICLILFHSEWAVDGLSEQQFSCHLYPPN